MARQAEARMGMDGKVTMKDSKASVDHSPLRSSQIKCSLIRSWKELKQSFSTPYQRAPGSRTEASSWRPGVNLTLERLTCGALGSV